MAVYSLRHTKILLIGCSITLSACVSLPFLAKKSPENETVSYTQSPGKSTPTAQNAPAEATASRAENFPEEKLDDTALTLSAANKLFRKHNHSKYLQTIQKSATNLVDKSRDVMFAHLCRDSLTDRWTVSEYYIEDKVYWFKSYNWDEIDEKWIESFKSEKRPLHQWKKHVGFVAAGKECTVLKGKNRLVEKPGRKG